MEQFYTAAAAHRYSAAWSLTDSNMQSQLGGYSAFQNQMSVVRSITFHQAQQTGTGSNTATVTVRTTSVQRDGSQDCAGTARTVRSGGSWLLDGISISCS